MGDGTTVSENSISAELVRRAEPAEQDRLLKDLKLALVSESTARQARKILGELASDRMDASDRVTDDWNGFIEVPSASEMVVNQVATELARKALAALKGI